MEDQEVPLDKSPAKEGCLKSSPDGVKKAFVLGVVNAAEIKCTVARKRRWDQPPEESPHEKKPCLDEMTDVPIVPTSPCNQHNSIQHSIPIVSHNDTLKSEHDVKFDTTISEGDNTVDSEIIVKEQIIVQTPSEILNQLDLNSTFPVNSGVNELNYMDGSRQVTIEIETVEVTPAEDVMCDDMPKTSIDKTELGNSVVNNIEESGNFSSDSATREPDWEDSKKIDDCSVVDVPLDQEESDEADQESNEQKSIDVISAGNVDPAVIEVILGIKSDSSSETPSPTNLKSDTENKFIEDKSSHMDLHEEEVHTPIEVEINEITNQSLCSIPKSKDSENSMEESPDKVTKLTPEIENDESSNDSSSAVSAPCNRIKLVDYELSNDKTDLTDSNQDSDLLSPLQTAKDIETMGKNEENDSSAPARLSFVDNQLNKSTEELDVIITSSETNTSNPVLPNDELKKSGNIVESSESETIRAFNSSVFTNQTSLTDNDYSTNDSYETPVNADENSPSIVSPKAVIGQVEVIKTNIEDDKKESKVNISDLEIDSNAKSDLEVISNIYDENKTSEIIPGDKLNNSPMSCVLNSETELHEIIGSPEQLKSDLSSESEQLITSEKGISGCHEIEDNSQDLNKKQLSVMESDGETNMNNELQTLSEESFCESQGTGLEKCNDVSNLKSSEAYVKKVENIPMQSCDLIANRSVDEIDIPLLKNEPIIEPLKEIHVSESNVENQSNVSESNVKNQCEVSVGNVENQCEVSISNVENQCEVSVNNVKNQWEVSGNQKVNLSEEFLDNMEEDSLKVISEDINNDNSAKFSENLGKDAAGDLPESLKDDLSNKVLEDVKDNSSKELLEDLRDKPLKDLSEICGDDSSKELTQTVKDDSPKKLSEILKDDSPKELSVLEKCDTSNVAEDVKNNVSKDISISIEDVKNDPEGMEIDSNEITSKELSKSEFSQEVELKSSKEETLISKPELSSDLTKLSEDKTKDIDLNMECETDDDSDSSMIEVPNNFIPSTEVSQDKFPDLLSKETDVDQTLNKNKLALKDIVFTVSDAPDKIVVNSDISSDVSGVLFKGENHKKLHEDSISRDGVKESFIKGESTVIPEDDSSNVEMIDDSPIPSVEVVAEQKADSIVGSSPVPPSPVCLSSDHQDSNSILLSYIDVQSEVVIVPDSDSESVQCVEQNSAEVINITSSNSMSEVDDHKNNVLKETLSGIPKRNFSLNDSEKVTSFLSQSKSTKNDNLNNPVKTSDKLETSDSNNRTSLPILKSGNVAVPPKLEPITLRIFKDNHSLHSESLDSPKRSRSPKSNERGPSSPGLRGSPSSMSPQSKQLEFTLRISKDANTNIPKATMSPKGSPGSVWKMDSKKNEPLPEITISSTKSSSDNKVSKQVWGSEINEIKSDVKIENVAFMTGVVNSDNRVSSVNSSLDYSDNVDVKTCINDSSSDVYFSEGSPSVPSSTNLVNRLDSSCNFIRDPNPTPLLKRRGRPRKTLLARALEAALPETPPPAYSPVDLSDPNAASRPMRECRDRTKPIVVKTRRPRGSSLLRGTGIRGGRGGLRVPNLPNLDALTPREREELAKIEARAERMREEKLAKRDAKLAKKALKLASCEPIILTDEQREELCRRQDEDDTEETPETARLREEVLKAAAEAAAAREAEMEALRIAKEEEKAAKVAARRAKLLSDYKAKRDAKLAKKLAKKLKDEERRKRKAAEKAAEQAALQNMYEDETRMSAGDFRNFREESQSSSYGNRKGRMEISIDPDSKDLGVEQLAEYQWEGSELFMIQEQVAEYLGVKSFKRKYPDLKRRPVEAEERKFLEDSGLVPKAMCDLGITAVSSAEVLDIMYQDFPEKYEEVRRYLREKQMREISTKQRALYMLSKQNEKAKADLREQALENAALWNSQLNRERREDRICSMDLQSLIIHYPASKREAMLSRVKAQSPGNYPVAVLPGQFCDYYKGYTSAELMYFPMNTVLYGPMRPNERQVLDSENSQSESEDSSSSDDSSGSSSSDSDSEVDEESAKCKICSLQKKLNKEGQQEKFIQCTKCKLLCHVSCCNLSLYMIPHVRKYQWRCPTCKVCLKCNNPSNPDKVITCDLCHRGYHTYCMGVKKVPDKRWHCQLCSYCWSCGTKESGSSDWIHEFLKDEKGGKNYIRTLCTSCNSGPLTSGVTQSMVVTPKGTQVFFKDSKQQFVIREEGSKPSPASAKPHIVITPNKRLEMVSHVTSVVNGAMKNIIIRK